LIVDLTSSTFNIYLGTVLSTSVRRTWRVTNLPRW